MKEATREAVMETARADSEETETAAREDFLAVMETEMAVREAFPAVRGDDRGRGDGRRSSGSRDSKPSFDTLQTKPTSTRQTSKKCSQDDRYDKRDREEDGKKKAPKTGKEAFIMPQPKKEEAKVR